MKIALCLVLSSLLGGAEGFVSRQQTPQLASLLQATPVAPAIDVSSTASRDIGTLMDWSAAQGVQTIDGFQYGGASEDDISVGTTQNIAAGTPVLQVPSSMILSSAQAKAELKGAANEGAEILGRLLMGDGHSPLVATQEFYLMIKVLQEFENGDRSNWFPWLNSLPRNYYNGASMTPFCYECLPPLVSKLAQHERKKFIYFHECLQSLPDSFLSSYIKSDKDITRWAYQIVTTRSNRGQDGDVRIVPVGDMFNHGTQADVQLSYDSAGNCIATAIRDIPANAPLCLSYSDPTNPSYLFARYGFLDESSPATFCKIMIDNPSAQIKQMGYDPSRMLFYKETGDVSPEVYDVLLYQLLEEDRDTQRAFYQAHNSGDTDTKNAIHQHYFPQTLQALQKHVTTFLGELEKLSAKAAANSPEEHPRLPLILRHNEFVRDTFLNVQYRMNEMAQ